jgi:hypothetical protein
LRQEEKSMTTEKKTAQAELFSHMTDGDLSALVDRTITENMTGIERKKKDDRPAPFAGRSFERPPSAAAIAAALDSGSAGASVDDDRVAVGNDGDTADIDDSDIEHQEELDGFTGTDDEEFGGGD